MKAIICTKYGPADTLKIVDYENPVPKEDEVLIKIHASSVTNSDIFIRSAALPLQFQIPMRLMIGLRRPRNEIIGEVYSGVIEKAGSKTKRFKEGDQVYGITGLSLGAYADYKCMKEKDSKRGCIALKPRNISHELATGAAYGGLLALQALEPMYIRPGDKVLIYGASSTTGLFALQYAKYLQAEVTCVCGGRNADFIRTYGIEKVLDYTSDDSVRELESYDVVMDAVGRARTSKVKEAAKKRLSAKGRCVSIDGPPLLNDSARLQRISQLVEANAVKPFNDRVFNFDEIIMAHEYVERGHKTGNVAVTVNSR